MAGRLPSGRSSTKRDEDLESVTSFASGPASIKPTIRYAWIGDAQVDHDSYHRMLEQYKAAKEQQGSNELKIKQLAAQLARTEEAAKRALARSDHGVKGSTIQHLLDAQRQVQQLQAENSELSTKLARERKRANEFRCAAEENRRRLEAALREQRSLVRKLGEAERSLGGSTAARTAARKAAAEQAYWSEEAGRRFSVQQEELISLREQNHQLQQQLAGAVPAETVSRYEASLKELQQQLQFCEQRLVSSAIVDDNTVDVHNVVSRPEGGIWSLEPLTEGGACYLWERSSGRVYSDPPDGQWPRPVGNKPSGTSSIQLGYKGRLDGALRALADALEHGRAHSPNRHSNSSRLGDALQHLLSKGGCVNSSCSSLSAAMVDSRDLLALLALLLPLAAHKELAEIAVWLAVPQQHQGGNSQGVSLRELDAAARELLTARDAVRQGRNVAINEALSRVRRLLRQESESVAVSFEEADPQGSGLSSAQIVELLKQQQLMPDLSPTEARHLHVLLHEWDVSGSNRHSLADLCAALQLLKLARVAPGSLGPERPNSHSSNSSSFVTLSSAITTQHTAVGDRPHVAPKQHIASAPDVSKRSAQAPGFGQANGHSVPVHTTTREAYLAERVSALEADLARSRDHKGAVNNQQVDALKAEVAHYQTRLTELENDFLSLDVVAKAEAGDYDAEMRKAWFTAAAFKKRYVEHKFELDSIKTTAEKMQAALDDTHRALHAEAARRMALEEVAAMANIEAARAKELAAAIAAERGERLKLEKDYLELQSKAFAAPGGALAEVRTLREELLAARRERAMVEAREADRRREIAAIKRQFEGVSPEEHRRVVRELAETQRKCVTCEMELKAGLEKLEVYRRTEATAAVGIGSTTNSNGAASAVVPELSSAAVDNKGEPELRAELSHLRLVVAQDAEEFTKMHKLLETEAAISLEAKAALEEAQSTLQAAKAESAQQLAKLRRELTARDEHIKKLEDQLRGAYSGLTKAAMRASAAVAVAGSGNVSARVSRIGVGGDILTGASLEDVLQGLGTHENLIELVVADAIFMEAEFPGEVSTFLAWDFFLHDSQATPMAIGLNPNYNTTVQYVVEMDDFLMEYLTQQQLSFDLFEARGWDATAVGAASLSLTLLLQDVRSGSGANRVWYNLDIVGSTGRTLGRVRVGARVAKTMDKLPLWHTTDNQHMEADSAPVRVEDAADQLNVQQQLQQQKKNSLLADPREDAAAVLQAASEEADVQLSNAAQILITIHSCEGLTLQQAAGQAVVQRPYVHYIPPGRDVGHDTAVGSGPAAVYNDTASWPLVRTASVQQALRHQPLQVAVFDDAVSHPAGALVGMATIPLDMLAESLPVEGRFDVLNPTTGQLAGTIQVSAIWQDPPPAAEVRALNPRAPLMNHHMGPLGAAPVETAAVQVHQQAAAWPQQPQQQVAAIPLLPAALNAAPRTSEAAAAAVFAALQSKQQQEVPLLQSTQITSPAAVFSSLHKPPSGVLLLAGQRLGPKSMRTLAHRYHSSATHQLQETETRISESVLQPGSVLPAAATGQSRLQANSQLPVLQRVDPNPSTWKNLDTAVYFKVDCLTLSPDALSDPALQHLLLAHMFCEDYTSADQQCTGTVMKGHGPLTFSYAVAYSIADPVSKTPTAAGIALADALAASEKGLVPHMVVPVLLASSQTPVVTDFSQVECVANCEIDLSGMWRGTSPDIVDQQCPLLPASDRVDQYPSGVAGEVCLTMIATQALSFLRRACVDIN